MSKSEDDDYYEVEKILDKKFENEKIFYLVKWKHFPDTDTSWEPEENMQKCTKLVEIFNKEQEKSKGIYVFCTCKD